MSLLSRRYTSAVRGLLFTASLLAAAMPSRAQVTYGGTSQVDISNHDVRSMAVDLNGVLYVVDGIGNLYKVVPDSSGQYGSLTLIDSNVNYVQVIAHGVGPFVLAGDTSPSFIEIYPNLTAPGTTIDLEFAGIFPFAIDNEAMSLVTYANGSWFAGLQAGFPGVTNATPVYQDGTQTMAMEMDAAHNIFSVEYFPLGGYYLLELPASGSSGWAAAPVVFTSPGFRIGAADSMSLDSFNNLYVPDPASSRIVMIPALHSSTGHESTALSVATPYAVAADRFGNLFYAQHAANFTGAVERAVRYPLIDFGSASIGTSVDRVLTVTVSAASQAEAIADVQNLVKTPPTFEYALIYGGTSCQGMGTNTYTCTVPVQFFPTGPGLRFGAIQIVDSSGNVVSTVYLTGTGQGPKAVFGFSSVVIGKAGTALNGVTLQSATALAADPGGNLYVLDKTAAKIIKYTRTGAGTYTGAALSLTGVPLTSNGLNYIAVDGAGYVYTDQGNTVVKVANGVASTVDLANLTLGTIGGLYADSYGTLHILDSQNKKFVMVPLLGLAELEGSLPGGTLTGIVAESGLGGGSGFAFLNPYGGYTGFNDTISVDTSQDALVTVRFPIPGRDGGLITGVPYAPSQLMFDQAGNALFADAASNSFRYNVVGLSGSGVGAVPILPPAGCKPSVLVQTMGGDFAATSSECGEVVVYPENDTLSLNFHSTPPNTTSSDSPQRVTLYNMGNKPLSITAPASGSNPALPSGFALDASTTCPSVASGGTAGSLAADANCIYAINFSPPSAGNYSGSVQLTDNTFNGFNGPTQSFTVTGTTIAPLTSFQVAISNNSTYPGVADALTVTALDDNGHTLTTFSGPVTLTSTDSGAAFSTVTLTNGVGTGTVTFAQLGSQTVTATASSVTGTSGTITVSLPPTFTVTNAADSGPGSLRAALASAASAGTGVINFDAYFSSPRAILLTSGTLTVPSLTTIQGYQSGSSINRTNTVIVFGNNSTTVFTVPSGAQGVTIQDLTILRGTGNPSGGIANAGNLTVSDVTFTVNQGSDGGAISNQGGVLTVIGSTFVANTSGSGGAISNENSGSATIINSTFFDNAAVYGGGIASTASTLTVLGSTFSVNFASLGGAGVYSTGPLSVGNTILSGNRLGTSGSPGNYDDLDDTTGTSTFIPANGNLGGNVIGYYNANSATEPSTNLAPLANYGGPQQTMLPLPASAAICAATPGNTGGASSDERGYNRVTTYGGTTCIDSGAAQTNYSIGFMQQPADTVVGVAISPAPAVQLYENGSVFSAANQTLSIALTNVPGNRAGSPSAATNATGLATFDNVQSTAADASETLTATLSLNSVSRTAVSNAFNFYSLAQSILFPALDTSVVYNHVSPTPLDASASSNLSVLYSVNGPASLSGNTLSYTGPGNITVTASQPGNGTYSAATPVSQSVTVAADASVPSLSTGSTGPPQNLVFTATSSFTIGAINVTTDGNLGNAYALASGGTCTVGLPLSAGQTCTVNITFKPTAPKMLTGLVTISDNAVPAQIAGTLKLVSVRYR